MAEWRLFPEGETPRVSTVEFHQDRERAQHLEQPNHRRRLYVAHDYVMEVRDAVAPRTLTVSDLGCGDGGLLQLLHGRRGIYAWGYDFTPANVDGARERGVAVNELDVFGEDRDHAMLGELVVMTEVLEHLADPHGVLRWLAEDGKSRYLVASSPWDETDKSHDECHAWAWDVDGYQTMLTRTGWDWIRHEKLEYKFQVVLARKAAS